MQFDWSTLRDELDRSEQMFRDWLATNLSGNVHETRSASPLVRQRMADCLIDLTVGRILLTPFGEGQEPEGVRWHRARAWLDKSRERLQLAIDVEVRSL